MPEEPQFSVVTTNKSGKMSKKGLIIGSIVVLFLAVSIVAGVILVQRQQNIQEKAATVASCPAAEACPVAGESDLLRSCTSVSDGVAPTEISCSSISLVGTVTTCGSKKYCCPSLGASWTTDITLCTTPSPTPTLSPTPTSSATASATPTNTATASATVKATTKATSVPIPVTGTSWPTIVGAGVGILVIVGSILLVI
jgi:hypothetical protein